MTLTEFLLARIADDETAAREVLASQQRVVATSPRDWPDGFDPLKDFYLGGADGPIGYTVLMVGVARVLAECEAKRAIIRITRGLGGHYEPSAAREAPGILRALAAVHVDHPDYDEAWRP